MTPTPDVLAGDIVCLAPMLFGLVEKISEDGKLEVKHGDGFVETFEREDVTLSAPTMFFEDIRSFAEKRLGWSGEQLWALHGPIAAGRDKMHFDVLSELLDKVTKVALVAEQPRLSAMTVEYDKRGVEVCGSEPGKMRRISWKQLEKEIDICETIKDSTLSLFLFWLKQLSSNEAPHGSAVIENFDPQIVKQFVDGPPKKPSKRGSRNKAQQNPASEAESPSAGEAEGEAYEGNWETIQQTAAAQSEEDVFSAYGFSEESEVPKSVETADGTEKTAAAADTASDTSSANTIPVSAECPDDPKSSSAPADSQTTATAAESAENDHTIMETGSPVPGSPAPVRTEAGLIDPDTGENIEPSMILRKLGWTEMPTLSENPSQQELDAFEAKVDQIYEKIATHLERVERWTLAHQERCKPFVDAADFWNGNFLVPLSKKLAEFRLPRFKSGEKKGQFSKKTLRLRSGSIQFFSGGGFYVHDSDLVKKHIREQGLENFKAISAEEVVKYDYQKLLSALKSGALKDIPGTGHKQETALATVKIVLPKPGKGEGADNAEEG